MSDHTWVGLQVFIETHRRILHGAFGRIPKALTDDAFSMAGYCLDAPDLLPAGSVVYERTGPEADDWIAMPSMFYREPVS